MTENNIEQLFQRFYQAGPDAVCHAPGRVNLIGDHTDYNDGFALPAAINFGTDIAASKRNDHKVRVYAPDLDAQCREFYLDDIRFNEECMWVNYIAGTLKSLLEVQSDISGADLVVTGNIPQGAGLSSSASFEIAILKTFKLLFDLELDGMQAALLGQKAENDFVGCSCGIMDQLVSAMGKHQHAMFLDCRSLFFEDAPVPDDYSILIVDSNVKRGLVDSGYNKRRKQCEQVATFFAKPALRDVTMEMLDSAKEHLSPLLYKRARHVVTENLRTEAAFVALKNNDIQALSLLMQGSHQSLKNDFEVTTSEIDGLVDIIAEVLGEQGGVRMTGGGFGGCVVAIAPIEMVAKVTLQVSKLYPLKSGLQPVVYLCNATQGAFRS